MQIIKKILVILLKKLEAGSSLGVRLVKLTRKSPYPIHPKHLAEIEVPWYLTYLTKDNVVLDLGCHQGHHAFRAARIVKRIVGVDIDEKQLKIAGELAQKQNLTNVRFKKINLEEKLSDFTSEQFDTVMLFDVLEHLKNRSQIMQEIHRVLKSKGLLLLSVPNKNTSWKKLQRAAGLNSFADSDHKIEYSQKEIMEFLKQHYFKVLKIEPVVYDTPMSGIIDFIGGISLSLYKKLQVWKRNYALKHSQESIGFRLISRKSLWHSLP